MILQHFSTTHYPRFADTDHALAPGLQVILCPDAATAITLQNFWTAMLFGESGATAGTGMLRVQLAQDRVLEILRNFDPTENETHVREIATDHRCEEIPAAFNALVFKGITHITPLALDSQQQDRVLEQLGRQLTALIDTITPEHDTAAAMKSMESYLDAIGRVGKTDTAYAALQNELHALDVKASEEAQAHEAAAILLEHRREVLATLETLHQEQLELEKKRHHSEAYARSQRFREAEQLHTRIETARQHAYALEDMADFPLERAQEVQKAETRFNTIDLQGERSRNALLSVTTELAEARQDLVKLGGVQENDLSETQEEKLHETARALENVRERMAQAQDEIEAGQRRLSEAQDAVAALPDFGRMAGEPMEWFSQLASSFSIAKRNRDEECAQRERLRETVEEKKGALTENTALFETCQNFPEQAREYELQHRMQGEQRQQCDTDLHQLRIQRDDTAASLPQFLWLAALCAMGLVGVLIVLFITGKLAILVAAGFILLALIFFVGSYITHRHHLDKLSSSIAESQAHLDMMATVENSGPDLIEALLEQSGCETIRELEARYDQYREALADLGVHESMLTEYESKAQEAEERLPKLLARLQAAFDQVDERIHGESDVEAAAGRAIAKYQEYREAKHALVSSRNNLDKWRDKHKQFVEEHAQAREAWEAMENMICEPLDETQETPTDALTLLRRYQESLVLRREKQARISTLEEKQNALHQQVAEEESQTRQHADTLETLLKELRVESPESFRDHAERAREYREVLEKADALEAQLETLLQGISFEELRDQVADESTPALRSPHDETALREDLDRIAIRIDQSANEAASLQEQLAQASANTASLTEIEEARSGLQKKMARMDLHREASIHAMSLLESCAQERHAQVAAALAPRASEYLAELSQGALTELHIDENLRISLPEAPLSPALTQQLYLALRLALATLWNETGESQPILLDNPVIDEDEESLLNSLVLLERVAEKQQCFLITQAAPLAEAAANLGTSVIRL